MLSTSCRLTGALLTSPVDSFRVTVASSTFSGDRVVLSIVLLSTYSQWLSIRALAVDEGAISDTPHLLHPQNLRLRRIQSVLLAGHSSSTDDTSMT